MSEPSEQAIRLAHRVHAANISIRPSDAARLIDAALDEAREDALPCDGDCRAVMEGPQETCSRHGRPVAEVWQVAIEAERERDEARATLERVTALADTWCQLSDIPQSFGAQVLAALAGPGGGADDTPWKVGKPYYAEDWRRGQEASDDE